MSNLTAPHIAPGSVYPLLSVNVGAASEGRFKGKIAKSGINKERAPSAVDVHFEGLSGDEQADTVNHGGPDKAVCAYPYRHYAFWEERLGRSLEFGAFGENFTIDEIDESQVCIGDVFKIGEVTLQISQPRVPCWKLAMKWGVDDLPAMVRDTGKTGFYFRVLSPGAVEPGKLFLVSRDFGGVTVEEANRVMHRGKEDREGMQRLLAVDALADSWRETLTARLSRLAQSR
ncbi:MOSC domain-containing protein [Cohnella hashimotonis]|uniref:MOSC domain-containing protein n=1 Tax=Cohnella hashimotonis TaxID=2826895 RepID=A0ABT6TGJ9_9BACL|nr:MOSC domain-containing protein [Cohnella hashimotonis]MDI4645706.1 MOSC domain-containing protein [Cohnella hashimotonis]